MDNFIYWGHELCALWWRSQKLLYPGCQIQLKKPRVKGGYLEGLGKVGLTPLYFHHSYCLKGGSMKYHWQICNFLRPEEGTITLILAHFELNPLRILHKNKINTKKAWFIGKNYFNIFVPTYSCLFLAFQMFFFIKNNYCLCRQYCCFPWHASNSSIMYLLPVNTLCIHLCYFRIGQPEESGNVTSSQTFGFIT